jgi:hypothetical protein
MAAQTRIHDIDGTSSLTFSTGGLPADDAVRAAEHEPNGYFREGIASFLGGATVARLELDSEAGMFSASGELPDLQALKAILDPLLNDRTAIADVIERATAAGFEFDD